MPRKTVTPRTSCGCAGGEKDPAMTYSRPRRTTIGPGCLTAVFGMGTGMAIRAWSPGYALDRWWGSGRTLLRVVSLLSSLIRGCYPGEGGNAAKRLAVSTGPLSTLLHLHFR